MCPSSLATAQRSNSPHRPRSPRSVNIAMLVGELRTEASRLVTEGHPEAAELVYKEALRVCGSTARRLLASRCSAVVSGPAQHGAVRALRRAPTSSLSAPHARWAVPFLHSSFRSTTRATLASRPRRSSVCSSRGGRRTPSRRPAPSPPRLRTSPKRGRWRGLRSRSSGSCAPRSSGTRRRRPSPRALGRSRRSWRCALARGPAVLGAQTTEVVSRPPSLRHQPSEIPPLSPHTCSAMPCSRRGDPAEDRPRLSTRD